MLEIKFYQPLKKEKRGGINGVYCYSYKYHRQKNGETIIEYVPLPIGAILLELNNDLTRFLLSPEYQDYEYDDKKKLWIVRTPGTAIAMDKETVQRVCHDFATDWKKKLEELKEINN